MIFGGDALRGNTRSHTVTSIVLSAASVLTIVFGMWTGVSQKRIATGKIEFDNSTVKNSLLDFLRKEVIQPHLPIRLPCYDFTPVIGFALGSLFIDRLWAPPTSMV